MPDKSPRALAEQELLQIRIGTGYSAVELARVGKPRTADHLGEHPTKAPQTEGDSRPQFDGFNPSADLPVFVKEIEDFISDPLKIFSSR